MAKICQKVEMYYQNIIKGKSKEKLEKPER
jgi:hypothetical protein